MVSDKQKKDFLVFLIDFLIVGVNTLLFACIYYRFYADDIYIPFYRRGNFAIILLFAILYISFAKVYSGFGLKITRAGQVFFGHVIASLWTGLVMLVILWLLIRYRPAFLPMLLGMILWSLAAMIWAKPAVLATAALYPSSRTMVVYGNEIGHEQGLSICKQVPRRFTLVKDVAVEDDVLDVLPLIQKENIQAVLVCAVSSSIRNDLLKYCMENGIDCYIRPNLGDFLLDAGKSMQVAHLPVKYVTRAHQSFFYAFLKRTFDIVFALFFLVLLSPLLLVTAIAIHAYDKGPVFYKQVRLTKNGKEFEIYKFRSMKVDAEKNTGAQLAKENDDRITPVGKFIRATRIDEIPQMINILKGDMSVVGPRPERPELAKEYEAEIPEFSLRLQVKAGLTGYAQVLGKYNTRPYDKLQMDLMYIAHQSVSTDLLLCLETFKILFQKESTEGIEKDKKTAGNK